MDIIKAIIRLTLVATVATPAASQEIGDAIAGLRYATAICSECHAVRREDVLSPELRAPRFEDVANTPGMTAIALFVWLQSSHPTMPMIILEPEDMRNVVEYILSLKRPPDSGLL